MPELLLTSTIIRIIGYKKIGSRYVAATWPLRWAAQWFAYVYMDASTLGIFSISIHLFRFTAFLPSIPPQPMKTASPPKKKNRDHLQALTDIPPTSQHENKKDTRNTICKPHIIIFPSTRPPSPKPSENHTVRR